MTSLPTENEFEGQSLSQVIIDLERQYICWAMTQAGGNKSKAAKMAGLTYQTFVRKLAGLNLKVVYHAE